MAMDMFYALAEPRRRKIIEILAIGGQMSATQIYNKFDISPQAISQHLKVLLDAKMLRMQKRAQQHIYEVDAESLLQLEDWVEQTRQQWNKRFDRLDRLLATEKKRNAKK